MKAAFFARFRTFTQYCLLFIFVLLASVVTADAQSSRTLASAGRRIDEFNRQSEKVARDELGREMLGRRPTGEERRQAVAKTSQIRQDLEHLQDAYNELVARLATGESADEIYYAGIDAKISRSALRLRHNVAFPDKSTESIEKRNEDRPAPSVRDVCLYVHAFLTSPLFETAVLDVTEAAKARDLLDRIILTSERLRQNRENLH
jgi:hypothetical protein